MIPPERIEEIRRVYQEISDGQFGRNVRDLLTALDEKDAEVGAQKERDADIALVIPQTYGEAIKIYPALPCPSHEWDNRTTAANLGYLISWLDAEVRRLEEKLQQAKEFINRLRSADDSLNVELDVILTQLEQ